MATSKTNLILDIHARTAGLEKGITQAEAKVNSLGARAKLAGGQMKAGFSNMMSGALMATAAIGATVAVISDLVQAAQVQELAEQKFAKALELSGNTAEGASQKYFDLASDLQKVTTVGDETTLGLMQLALSMGASEDQLEGVTKGAIGLSESLGIDLNSAVKMVTLGVQGEFTMLNRYIPALRTAGTEAEKTAIFQKALADGFEVAKDKAQSSAGKMQQLSNNFGDLKETLGNLVIPVLDRAVTGLNNVVGSVQDLINGIKSFNTEDIAGSMVSGIRSIAEYSTLGLSETALGWIGLGKDIEETKEKQKDFTGEIEKSDAPAKKLFRNAEMIGAELSLWRTAANQAKSELDLKEANENVERLQKELDKLNGVTDKTKKGMKGLGGTVPPVAGSMAYLREQLSTMQKVLDSQLVPGTQAYADLLNKIYDKQREISKTENMWFVSDKAIENIPIKPIENLAGSLLSVDVNGKLVNETMTELKTTFDDTMLFAEQFGSAGDMIQQSMLSIGNAIGGSLVGSTDMLKDSLKTVLTLLLETLQAELLAADAAMAVRALFTAGISLTTDLALAALAYGGVEIAKGAINSFAIGSPYIPQNQLAFVHKGERVMTERENKEYTSSQSPQRNKSFMLGPKTNRMRGQVSVSVDTFGRATDYNDFQMQESVF